MGAWHFRSQAPLRTHAGGKDEEMSWKLERVRHAAIDRPMEEVEDARVIPRSPSAAFPRVPKGHCVWDGGTQRPTYWWGCV